MSRVSLRQGRDGRLQLRILAFFERIGVNFQVGVVIDLDRDIWRDADARKRYTVRGLIMAGRNSDGGAVAQDEGLLIICLADRLRADDGADAVFLQRRSKKLGGGIGISRSRERPSAARRQDASE